MEKTGYIYKITNPSNKIYIGKTVCLNARISNYRRCNGIKEQKIIYNSIKKYGWENHIFEIITEAPQNILSDLEIKYIKEYNSFHYDNPDGMNLTKGGDGSLGRKDTFETIQKRINSIKGRKHSEQTKQLMSSLKKGKPSSSKGVPCSEQRKQKISQSNKGKLRSKLTTEKINQTKLLNLIKKHECILQIDKATNKIIKEWITLPKFISNELGICSSNIAKCLNHKKPHAVGYIWRYKK